MRNTAPAYVDPNDEFNRRHSVNQSVFWQLVTVPSMMWFTLKCFNYAYGYRRNDAEVAMIALVAQLPYKKVIPYEGLNITLILESLQEYLPEFINNPRRGSISAEMWNQIMPDQPSDLLTLFENFGITWGAGAPVPFYLHAGLLAFIATYLFSWGLTKSSKRIDLETFNKHKFTTRSYLLAQLVLGWHLPLLLAAYKLPQFSYDVTLNVGISLIPGTKPVMVQLPIAIAYTDQHWLKFLFSTLIDPMSQLVSPVAHHGEATAQYVADLMAQAKSHNLQITPAEILALIDKEISKGLTDLLAMDTIISNAYYLSLVIALAIHVSFCVYWLGSWAHAAYKKRTQTIDVPELETGLMVAVENPVSTNDRTLEATTYAQSLEQLLLNSGGLTKLVSAYLIGSLYFGAVSNLISLANLLPLSGCDVGNTFWDRIKFTLKNLVIYQDAHWSSGACPANNLYTVIGSMATNPATIVSILSILIDPLPYLILFGIGYAAYRAIYRHKNYPTGDNYSPDTYWQSWHKFDGWLGRKMAVLDVLPRDEKILRTVFRGSLSWLGLFAVVSYFGVGLQKAKVTGDKSYFFTFVDLFNIPNSVDNVSLKSGFIASAIFTILYGGLLVFIPTILTYVGLLVKKAAFHACCCHGQGAVVDEKQGTLANERYLGIVENESFGWTGVAKSTLKAAVLTAMFYYPYLTVYETESKQFDIVVTAAAIGSITSFTLSRIDDILNLEKIPFPSLRAVRNFFIELGLPILMAMAVCLLAQIPAFPFLEPLHTFMIAIMTASIARDAFESRDALVLSAKNNQQAITAIKTNNIQQDASFAHTLLSNWVMTALKAGAAFCLAYSLCEVDLVAMLAGADPLVSVVLGTTLAGLFSVGVSKTHSYFSKISDVARESKINAVAALTAVGSSILAAELLEGDAKESTRISMGVVAAVSTFVAEVVRDTWTYVGVSNDNKGYSFL